MTKHQPIPRPDSLPFSLTPAIGDGEGQPTIGLVMVKDRNEDPEENWRKRYPNEELPNLLVTLHFNEIRPLPDREDTRCAFLACMSPAALEYFLALFAADK